MPFNAINAPRPCFGTTLALAASVSSATAQATSGEVIHATLKLERLSEAQPGVGARARLHRERGDERDSPAPASFGVSQPHPVPEDVPDPRRSAQGRDRLGL